MLTLRPYQQECVDIIDRLPNGSSDLVQMATGLGKTVTFSRIKRRGRMLILSHREELVHQPLKYFDCFTGVEMAGEHASPMAEVVSASVQTLTRRLDRFARDEFDILITDEAHHAAAQSYRRIYEHFTPRLHVGFTATPGRGDKVRLDDIYSDIIFQRDLRWGIENNYLSDIFCRRVNIGYDLSAVRTSHGDYAPGELEEAMDGTADAIAETYRELAEGATLIFAVSVKQAEEIAKRIPGAAVVTGETKDRASIIQAFTAGTIPCIVNVMVFTEGTDIPRVETIIIARPTQNDSLYTQMVGRGLRLYPGKKRLNLIDCVGVTGRASLCTAPSLLGIDMKDVPARTADTVQGDLFDLPLRAAAAADVPESWIKNVEIINLWAKEQKYQTHDVNWFKMPDGSMVCSLPDRVSIKIGSQDELGRVMFMGNLMPMQHALDQALIYLEERYSHQRMIWDLRRVKQWGSAPASDKQMEIIRKQCKGFDATRLTKAQASQILNRIIGGKTA
jgi:type I site-specific restriction endonuclease